MSPAAAKQFIRRFYSDMFGDVAAAERCIGPDYVDHNHEDAGRGPKVFRAHVEAVLQTFPDFRLIVEDMIAEGDQVVTRVAASGTHGGTWRGIPPSGNLVRVKGINIDRIVGGRIVEHWGEADTVGMLMQMGIDPFGGRK